MKLIDTPWDTSAIIDCLKNEGVGTVIRYYNNGNSTTLPQKRLELQEAQALSAGGLQIAVVFQLVQDSTQFFSEQLGYDAGVSAFNWAKNTIGQPAGSAIYFAVDYNPNDAEVQSNIVPYFEGVAKAFASLGGDYKVGAYGSGLVVNTLRDQSLCEFRWLSMSSGYYGTQDALNEGNFELHQIYPSAVICNIAVDYDEKNPTSTDIGSFSLNGAS
jgi:hypothetical protein